MAYALRVLLWPALATNTFWIKRHVKLQHESLSAVHYEIDIAVGPASEDRMVAVEVSSPYHHAATAERYTCEVRRARELMRISVHVVTCSTTEVREDLWATALHVVETIASIDGFADLRVPDTIYELARSFARGDRNVVIHTPSSNPGALSSAGSQASGPDDWDATSRAIARIPDNWSVVDPVGKQIKAAYSRAFQAWHTLEDESLRRAHAAGLGLDTIARLLHRHPTAIARRLRKLGLA